jgi:thioredoxin 1
MTMSTVYEPVEPTRNEVEAIPGIALLEFGTSWCGHCRAVQPLLQAALANRPELRHLKIADGRGRPLGRSYRVTLWPTLVVLRDGHEAARLVRPTSLVAIQQALASVESEHRPGP